jgi:hypothetical protein
VIFLPHKRRHSAKFSFRLCAAKAKDKFMRNLIEIFCFPREANKELNEIPHKFIFPRRFAARKRKFCGMTAPTVHKVQTDQPLLQS